MSILKTQCEHQGISFKQNLLTFIDDYSDKGSVHEETLRTPCGAKEICFVDYAYCGTTLPSSVGDVMYESVKDCTHNIFMKTKFTEAVALSDKVALKQDGSSPPIDESYKCFEVRGDQIKFLFMGLGRKTYINST